MASIAINGPGRIGRSALKIIERPGGAEVVAVNDLVPPGSLAGDGIAARVIDLYSVKPVDQAAPAAAAGERLAFAEGPLPPGRPRRRRPGGPGRGLRMPLRVRRCAVSGLPGWGTPDELTGTAGIPVSRIAAARELLKD